MRLFQTRTLAVGSNMMIVVDARGEVNPKETKAQLTTTAGALDMRGFD
jgi:hypothetical protein